MPDQKPKFDPSKPFEPAVKPKFDPSKPFTEKPGISITPAESAIAGVSQGVTLGFEDEILGGIRGALATAKGEGKFTENYKKFRDEQREFNKKALEQNPKSYIGGNVAGSVGFALLPGIGQLGNVAKGATVAARVGKAATVGGVAGAGLSEANPIESPSKAGEFAKDVASGAAIGGAFQGAGEVVGKVAKAIKPENLKQFANQKALTTAGYMAKDLNKLSPDQRQMIGRQLIDNKIVTVFSSLDDIAEKSGALKEKSGKAIGDAISNVDDLVSEIKTGIKNDSILPGLDSSAKQNAIQYLDDNFQFNMKRVGEKIRNLADSNSDNPLLENEVKKLYSIADGFVSKPSKTLGTGNIIKGTQGKATRFQSETVPESFKKQVYGIIKTELEDVIAKTGNLESELSKISGKNIGSELRIPERNAAALEAYKSAKNTYQAAKVTEDVAFKRIGQQQNLRSVSLTDTIAAAGGFAQGGPVTAVTLGALNKIARKYGASVQSISADKLANGIEAAISKSPELLKQASPLLAEAAKKGNASVIAVHAMLMKKPEYRDIMERQNSAFDRELERRSK